MSYKHAKKCLKENMDEIDQHSTMEPDSIHNWNLNSGLAGLVDALQRDLDEIRLLLQQIIQDQQRPRPNKPVELPKASL